jgi:hypothetical protein
METTYKYVHLGSDELAAGDEAGGVVRGSRRDRRNICSAAHICTLAMGTL